MAQSMHWPRLLLGLLAALVLAGCAAEAIPAAPQPPDAVRRTTEKDGRFLVLTGPQLRHAEPFVGIASTNFYLLRSFIDTRSGETVHQLYVEDSYPGAERNWNAARLAYGGGLRFVPVSKQEITCDYGCSYAEEFAASLPDAVLRANPQGLTVVFTARTGIEKTVVVPGDLIAKQLAAVTAARANPATAAAAATPAAASSAPAPPPR
jgi:hypothetical protein